MMMPFNNLAALRSLSPNGGMPGGGGFGGAMPSPLPPISTPYPVNPPAPVRPIYGPGAVASPPMAPIGPAYPVNPGGAPPAVGTPAYPVNPGANSFAAPNLGGGNINGGNMNNLMALANIRRQMGMATY
jgi:hypothetical protein